MFYKQSEKTKVKKVGSDTALYAKTSSEAPENTSTQDVPFQSSTLVT